MREAERDTNRLTDRQQLIYNIIAGADTDDDTNRTTPTSTSIADALKVSLSTIKRELDKMKDIGVILGVGPTFGGHYFLRRTRGGKRCSSVNAPSGNGIAAKTKRIRFETSTIG